MNKFKKGLTSVGLAIGVAVGGAVITAPASHAVTYGSPYKVQTGGYWCPVFMHADYNWWEEVFLGKRDGAVYQYSARC